MNCMTPYASSTQETNKNSVINGQSDDSDHGEKVMLQLEDGVRILGSCNQSTMNVIIIDNNYTNINL